MSTKVKKRSVKRFPIKETVGLFVNLFLPGLGTAIGGEFRKGLLQLIFYMVGIPLIIFFFLGVFVMLGVWVWAIISSVRQIQKVK